jgi:hypothetical protein
VLGHGHGLIAGIAFIDLDSGTSLIVVLWRRSCVTPKNEALGKTGEKMANANVILKISGSRVFRTLPDHTIKI